MKKLILLWLLLWPSIAFSQSAIIRAGSSGSSFDEAGNYTLTGTWDFSGATITYPADTITAAEIDETDAYAFSDAMFPDVAFASLPAAGTGTRFRRVTDCESTSECSVGSGSIAHLFFDDGTTWQCLTCTNSTPTLSSVMGAGNSYYSATSAGTGLQIGQSSSYMAIFDDVTLGPRAVCVISGVVNDCDKVFSLNSGYKLEVKDSSGNSVWRISESTGRVTYPTAAKAPLKSVFIPAQAMVGDGTNCPATPTAVTINSGPKIYTYICADSSSSILYSPAIHMPDSWDGGTVTATLSYIQTAADTGSMLSDIDMQCRGNGEVPSSTWGTAIAIDDAAVVGSNANDMATSAAVTPAGTCAGGDMLYVRWTFDTASTTASATLHFLGIKIEYSVSGNSD